MAANITAIAQGNTVLTLALTGVPVEELTDVKAVEDRLIDLMDSDIDAVIVDEFFRDKFSEFFENRLARHSGLPLIIFCPSFEEAEATTDAYINSIVKPAVGFEIRLD